MRTPSKGWYPSVASSKSPLAFLSGGHEEDMSRQTKTKRYSRVTMRHHLPTTHGRINWAYRPIEEYFTAPFQLIRSCPDNSKSIINLNPEWLTLKDSEYESRLSVVAFIVVPNWKITGRLLGV